MFRVNMTSRQIDTSICLLLSASLLLIYSVTMPQWVTFEDSGLFLQVCHFNGIAHPPGYPLFTLLCVPWFWLPFDPVILGNSLSLTFAILTCVVVYFILKQLGVRNYLAGFTSLLLGLSLDFWSQAIVIEVYSLNTFLISVAIYLAIEFAMRPRRGLLFALSFILGLGISNHWPLVLLSAPGIALICLAKLNTLMAILRSKKDFMLCILSGLLGLTPYLSLFLKQDAVFAYSGPVTSVAEFFSYVSREVYQGVDQSSTADLMDKLQFIKWLASLSLQQFGLLFGLIALVGLVRGLTTMRLITSGLLIIFLTNTILLTFLLGFDFDFAHRAIFRTYPLLAWLCMALWTGLGLQWISDAVRVRQVIFVPVIIFAGAVVAILNFVNNDRSQDKIAYEYARQVLRNLEPESSLIITSDSQVGPISYLNQVVGLRPDVTLYHAKNLFFSHKLQGDTPLQRKEFTPNLPLLYSIGIPWLPDGEDYGLFLKHGDNLHGANIVPQPGKFIVDLVHEYREGRIQNPLTLYFTHQLLIAIGNQLANYAFTHKIDEDVLLALRSVQQTFPGILATLSTVLANPQYPMPHNIMLGMAKGFENDIPIETPDYEIAAYYFYMAKILTSPDATLEKDEELARHYLRRGLIAYPVPENPGLCLYRELAPSADLPFKVNFQTLCQ